MSMYPSTRAPAEFHFDHAEVYNFIDYDPDEHAGTYPPPNMENVFAAAVHVGKLITDKGFHYALLGGVAMAARGGGRTTSDVDIGTDATMKDLWELLDDKRIILPDSKLADIVRLFIRTGPAHGDKFLQEDTEVQVDIITAGGISVPRDLEKNIQLIGVKIGDFDITLSSLSDFALLRSKLRTFAVRRAQRDFDDVCTLLDTCELASSDMAELDPEHSLDFVESDFFAMLSKDAAKSYSTKLQLARV